MPSGRTHDRITLWCLPFLIGLTILVTRSYALTLIVALSFLVGGFMLGPDLDIHSIQYKRWGPIRWIWLPYQIALKHRSRLSHGPIIGTALRVIYLAVWIGLFTVLTVEILNAFWDAQLTLGNLNAPFRYLARNYLAEWISVLVGLELGAISHSASDTIGSYWGKRWAKQKRRRKKNRKKS
ncbi:MAG: metal-binding protein [Cyanobacteria bacterium P01_D01_bin.105]